MEGSFSSPRTDSFPAGLRVLVVDDDLAWLRILEKMLKKCSYEVTTCCLAREALDLLRERKDGFDIVISDVNMPDMDGFKLLEHVGLEMDLPVIMMSVDGETSRVMRGVQHGACDYLLKPIRMKELRNIWQHVFRKRIHEVRDIEGQECMEEFQMMRHGSELSDEWHSFSGGELNSGKKRKDVENKYDDKDFGDPSSAKKARVVWTVDLHQKFVRAVNQIGFDICRNLSGFQLFSYHLLEGDDFHLCLAEVGPKKILDLMSVPWLTRENVASHLQKYRLYLSRLPKDNDLKAAFGVVKQLDLSSQDSHGSLGLQNSLNTQQTDAASGIYGISGNKPITQNANPKFCEGDLKGIVSVPLIESKKATIHDIPDPPKASSSRTGPNHTFGPLEPDVKYGRFDSPVRKQYSWCDVPQIQFKQEHKVNLQIENGFNHLPSVSSRPFTREREKPGYMDIKPPYTKCSNQQIRQAIPIGSGANSFHVQSENPVTSFQAAEPTLSATTWSMKNHGLSQIFINNMEAAQRNLVLGSNSGFASMDGDLLACLLQGDRCPTNVELLNKESLNHNSQDLFAETPAYVYDAQRFDYEYPLETMEYPVIDQGLFIV
ncbi:hypothetical protein RHMOL_Rhmol12G0122400 [Rhododendron molle]|uniref:Uncharacterized protein n=1 Tax=Rhododendron molle TaxID=49168 RepID=A0ACC0LIH4_RHOML|nr:hypothetical protein RHMOL_Rhmol12G0122400 [Rhododendron molle]